MLEGQPNGMEWKPVKAGPQQCYAPRLKQAPAPDAPLARISDFGILQQMHGLV